MRLVYKVFEFYFHCCLEFHCYWLLGHCIVGGNSGIAMIELDWIRRWTVLVEPIRVLEIFGANQVCHGFDADSSS